MCDQLRWDYLSCSGHPTLETPNIDALAARGVRFERAYAQAAVCGPSRASFYTGRYMNSHGVYWNAVPLRPTEWTLADYLAPAGMSTVLVGKCDLHQDQSALKRLGLDAQPPAAVCDGGFTTYIRDDGIHLDSKQTTTSAYNRWLAARGYAGDNPWHNWVNSVDDGSGGASSGWMLKNSGKPARVKAEDSETPYTTRCAMDFIDRAGAQPWCLHVSFNKPHWPYIAPAPYHSMYAGDAILPAARSTTDGDHPVRAAFMEYRGSKHLSDDAKRAPVAGAYMGLVNQIDAGVGELVGHLEKSELLADTLIVFTSDHGDYLGDHHLCEKYLLHDASVRIPLIVVDPRLEADGTRGSVSSSLVEAIDLVPTFADAAGADLPRERLEGRSLCPLLNGTENDWRELAFAESNYGGNPARSKLGLSPAEAHCWMVTDGRHKYVLHQRFEPELYDLDADPDELRDLAGNPEQAATQARLHEALFAWFRRPAQLTTVDEATILRRAETVVSSGIKICWWDENG